MKNNWKDVTLDEFLELAKIEVDKELNETPLKRALKRVVVLSGKTEAELLDLSGSEFGLLIKEAKFTEDEPVFEQPETFTLDGVEYGFRAEGELSAGEYISLEVAIADARRTKSSAFPAILGVLIRPLVRKNSEEFGELTKVEKFDVQKHKLRVAKFKRELCVPFFICALSSITAGENGIKKVVQNFMTQGSTTKQASK
jgi:hypothetical protein